MRVGEGVCCQMFSFWSLFLFQQNTSGNGNRLKYNNVFFATVVNVAYTRFKADKALMDALRSNRRRNAGEPGLATSLWGMLYADDAENSMFARLGTDYEIRNQWFFAILEAMTTD